ncbi:MAG: LytS/YhcK type 5TM receptor domain-containing protein [Coriobacteriia bacterium]|nr:LytS/YhcK type 5TM receptor domain-containing protein [Coriobacteriia bacterium]
MSLFISGIITVGITVGAFYMDKKTSIGKLKPFYKQTVYGLMFAMAAIFATELGGQNLGGALINARDAAIVVAGLLFGP